MWRRSSPERVEAPIDHVTNGAHLATFVGEPMRTLLRRAISATRWLRGAGRPRGLGARARHPERRALGGALRGARGGSSSTRSEEPSRTACSAASSSTTSAVAADRLDADTLTLGFARRLASYKRLRTCSTSDPDRARPDLHGEHPASSLIAGKAHPNDERGQGRPPALLQTSSTATAESPGASSFVEDYDLAHRAGSSSSGCDVWVNLPRQPLEASGTSGMKATFNGALQLSVLDGWWAEGYDGTNGWAIAGTPTRTRRRRRRATPTLFYDLLEHEVVPLFYERDADGVRSGWCDRVKEALVTLRARRSRATRMVDDYVERIYRT